MSESAAIVPINAPAPVKVEFQFGIGDCVVINGSSIEGHVTALLHEDDTCQYRIAYWYSGARSEVWVYAREIRRKVTG